MPEGPRDPGSPNRRGRRNPALLAQQQVEEQGEPSPEDFEGGFDDQDPEGLMQNAGEQLPEELPILFAGDVVMGRASISTKIMGFEHWFAWGISSRVQPGESAEDAFMRVGAQVSESVLDLAAAMEEKLTVEETRRQEAERSRPIRRRNH